MDAVSCSSLNALKEKKLLDKYDYQSYLNVVIQLTKSITDLESFSLNSSSLKTCIGSFVTIFLKSKIDVDLKNYISKTCDLVTKLYSRLEQHFYRYEPEYVQRFYSNWKDVLCIIIAKKRAESCVKNIDSLKVMAGHLRTAKNRFIQMAIFDVLRSYTEKLSLTVLNELKVNDDGQDFNVILDIIKMGKPTYKSLHTWLTTINLTGDKIFTVRPSRAIPVNFKSTDLKERHECWFDFNLKDQSVTFVVLSLIDHDVLCMGHVRFPEIQDYVLTDEYQLIISGAWSLVSKSGNGNTGNILEIVFFCQPGLVEMVAQVKNTFKFSPYRGYGIAELQDKNHDQESILTDVDTKTIFFNELTSNDDDAATHPTPAKVARTNTRSSASDDNDSVQMPASSLTWFVKDDRGSETFTLVPEQIHDHRSSKNNFHNDSLRVNYNSNKQHIAATTKATVSNGDNENESLKRKLPRTNCDPQQMDADSNVFSPKVDKQVQILPDVSSKQAIQGQIKRGRLSCVITTTETSNKVHMSVVCESHNAHLKETDNMKRNEEGGVQTQRNNGPAESNSDGNRRIAYNLGPDLGVTANYNENLQSSSISHQVICDMNNGINLMINFHMELILDTLKKLTQCIESFREFLETQNHQSN